MSFPWPLPALIIWGLCWVLHLFLLRRGLDAASVVGLSLLVSLLLSSRVKGWWRKLVTILGYPLSLLLLSFASGSMSWLWLLPLVLLLLLYPLTAWRDAPLFPTPEGALDDLPEVAVLEPGAKILDAGCGLGHGLEALRRAYPLAELRGIEMSRALVWACRWRTRHWTSKVQIERGDIWQHDWSGYDLVYLFQRPESMPRAIDKARAEMKPGAYLVSLEFEAQGVQALAKLEGDEQAGGKTVWVYRLPF